MGDLLRVGTNSKGRTCPDVEITSRGQRMNWYALQLVTYYICNYYHYFLQIQNFHRLLKRQSHQQQYFSGLHKDDQPNRNKYRNAGNNWW